MVALAIVLMFPCMWTVNAGAEPTVAYNITGVALSVVFGNAIVSLNTLNNCTEALRLDTGAVLWSSACSAVPPQSYLTGVSECAGDLFAVFNSRASTVAMKIDGTTGRVIWKAPFPYGLAVSVACNAKQSVLFSGVDYPEPSSFPLVAYNGDTGAALWQHASGGSNGTVACFSAAAATGAGVVYVCDGDAAGHVLAVCALDLLTGRVKWSRPSLPFNAVAGNGDLYGWQNGFMWRYDGSTGTLAANMTFVAPPYYGQVTVGTFGVYIPSRAYNGTCSVQKLNLATLASEWVVTVNGGDGWTDAQVQDGPGAVYFSTWVSGAAYATVLADNGSTLWRGAYAGKDPETNTLGLDTSTGALYASYQYFVAEENDDMDTEACGIVAFDALSGNVLWYREDNMASQYVQCSAVTVTPVSSMLVVAESDHRVIGYRLPPPPPPLAAV